MLWNDRLRVGQEIAGVVFDRNNGVMSSEFGTWEVFRELLLRPSCSVVISQTRWLVSRVRLAPDGWNCPIYFVHSGAICPAVVLNRSWCITPHSSPTRGCWPRWSLQIYPASLPPQGDHVTPCSSGSLFDYHGIS